MDKSEQEYSLTSRIWWSFYDVSSFVPGPGNVVVKQRTCADRSSHPIVGERDKKQLDTRAEMVWRKVKSTVKGMGNGWVMTVSWGVGKASLIS